MNCFSKAVDGGGGGRKRKKKRRRKREKKKKGEVRERGHRPGTPLTSRPEPFLQPPSTAVRFGLFADPPEKGRTKGRRRKKKKKEREKSQMGPKRSQFLHRNA